MKDITFVIMAGGRANRLGRGIRSVDMTKGLMTIPTEDGGITDWHAN